MTITGWYILKGFNSESYTLLSIHGGTQLIYALSYDLNNLEIKSDLKSSSQTNVVPFLTNSEWIYIKIQVELALATISTDTASVFVQQTSTLQFTFTHSHTNSLGEPMNFDSSMSINSGYSSSQIGFTPACALLKYVRNSFLLFSQSFVEKKTFYYKNHIFFRLFST